MEKAVYLLVHELLILLYRYQIGGLIFPLELTQARAEGWELKSAMGSLVSDGRLTPSGESGFTPAPEIREWLGLLESAEETLILRDCLGEHRECYLYGKGKAALLQPDARRRGFIRIAVRSEQEAIEELQTPGLPLELVRYRKGENIPCERRRLPGENPAPGFGPEPVRGTDSQPGLEPAPARGTDSQPDFEPAPAKGNAP